VALKPATNAEAEAVMKAVKKTQEKEK